MKILSIWNLAEVSLYKKQKGDPIKIDNALNVQSGRAINTVVFEFECRLSETLSERKRER